MTDLEILESLKAYTDKPSLINEAIKGYVMRSNMKKKKRRLSRIKSNERSWEQSTEIDRLNMWLNRLDCRW